MARFSCLLLSFLLAPILLPAQSTAEPPVTAAQTQPPDTTGQAASRVAVSTNGDVNWKRLPGYILQDQKQIYFDYPRGLVHGRNWLPTVAFVAGTLTLSAIDQYESPYFRGTTSFHGLNKALSGTNTSLAILGVPAVTYLTGFLRKDRYAQSTALYTAEALVDSEITSQVLKLVTQRARPENIQLRGNFADTWWDSSSVGGGGFPSGHTISAFSVATVMSKRYGRNHRWVPYVAYGAAATVGLSRVTLSAHNVSDVFAGAFLGYVISRYVVLRHAEPVSR